MLNYSSQLQENNAELQNILDAVNTLPEAGSGGGTSIDTCTVIIEEDGSIPSYGAINDVLATQYVDGAICSFSRISTIDGSTPFPLTISNVVCGSTMFIGLYGAVIPGYDTTGASVLAGGGIAYAHITAAAGETAVITYSDRD